MTPTKINDKLYGWIFWSAPVFLHYSHPQIPERPLKNQTKCPDSRKALCWRLCNTTAGEPRLKLIQAGIAGSSEVKLRKRSCRLNVRIAFSEANVYLPGWHRPKRVMESPLAGPFESFAVPVTLNNTYFGINLCWQGNRRKINRSFLALIFITLHIES